MRKITIEIWVNILEMNSKITMQDHSSFTFVVILRRKNMRGGFTILAIKH